jgi:ribosomal protein S18 acetylase RimI-like enzyme
MDHDPDSLPTSSQTNVLVRPVRHPDISAVTLLDASISAGQPRPAYFEERLAIIERSDTGQQLIFLVADSRDRIVGFVLGTLTVGQFGLPQITAVIDFIAVHPEYRRQHIGRRLIEAFLSQSAALGAKTAYTLVQWENWELLRVFHMLGFSMPSTIPLERKIS